MSNVYEFAGQEKGVNERAVRASSWIAKMDRGLSDSEIEELRSWMLKDRANARKILEMARLWDKMDILAHLSALFPDPAPTKASLARRNPYRTAVAATVVVALLGVVAIVGSKITVDHDNKPESIADFSTYETAIGGLSRIELSDGSEITLNTNSRVEVNIDERQRLLILTRGEIHVEVAHDSARPLRVVARGRVVQAVGTAFSVKIDALRRVEVLVAQGRVRVGMHAQGPTNLQAPNPTGISNSAQQSFYLAGGERATLGAAGNELQVLAPEEVEAGLSWRKGNLVFRGESLAEAATEVSRYSPVDFVFLDEELEEIRVAGLFKAGDVSGFLYSLQANLDIAYERLGDHTILLSTSERANADVSK